MIVIDSHVHFLDPSRAIVPWARSDSTFTGFFGPAEYFEQAPVGMQVIHVEAGLNQNDRAAEAAAIATLGVTWPALRAQVVADVPALSTDDRYLNGPGMRTAAAVRVSASSLLQGLEPRARALLDRDLALELLCDIPLTPELVAVIRQLPRSLPLIIDHAANPPIATGWKSTQAQDWAVGLEAIAQRDNVTVKLSGMATMARDPGQWKSAVEPFVIHALATFGPTRSMFGSDWPLCTKADDAGPAEWLGFLFRLCSDSASFAEVSSETCRRAYRIPLAGPTPLAAADPKRHRDAY